MENVVYLHLRRNDYTAYVGQLPNKEIDFMAEKNGNRMYVQVAYMLVDQSTINREFGNLESITDQYPKYVVTMDEFWKDSIEGVQHLYITDFLMKEVW